MGLAAAIRRIAMTSAMCVPPASILSRSYTAPRYFPFPPFNVVLESTPGACDFAAPAFKNPSCTGTKCTPVPPQDKPAYCAAFKRGELMMPEPFVVQSIASFLAKCTFSAQPCNAVDLGGNLGIHTSYMAALGAMVHVVEPQTSMALAIRDTISANCWQSRVTLHHGGVTANETEDGTALLFKGGWSLADRGHKHPKYEQMRLYALQPLLRGKRIDLLKIDIDNSIVEEKLMLALVAMLDKRETDLRAFVMEAVTGRAVKGLALPLAHALSRLQLAHGFNAYRLAHHLHTIDQPDVRWYSPCISARAFKYVLYVRPLPAAEWMKLLKADADRVRGRADTMSLVFSKEVLGREAEAQWHSDSMRDADLPPIFRNATCGAPLPQPPRPKASPPPLEAEPKGAAAKRRQRRKRRKQAQRAKGY